MSIKINKICSRQEVDGCADIIKYNFAVFIPSSAFSLAVEMIYFLSKLNKFNTSYRTKTMFM